MPHTCPYCTQSRSVYRHCRPGALHSAIPDLVCLVVISIASTLARLFSTKRYVACRLGSYKSNIKKKALKVGLMQCVINVTLGKAVQQFGNCVHLYHDINWTNSEKGVIC